MSKYYIVEISTDYMGPRKLQLTEWKLREPKTKNPKMISLGGTPGSPIHIVSAEHNPWRFLDMWLAPRPKRGAHADPGCSSTNGVDQVALYVKKVSEKVKITWTTSDRKDGEQELCGTVSFSSAVQLGLCRVLDGSATTGDGATYEFRVSFASASAPVSATGLASDSDHEVFQRRHHLVVKTVEIMRAFCKQTLIPCRPRGPDQTCLEAALALNPRDDPWTKYLHALLRMRAEPSLEQVVGTALPPAPAWLTDLGPLAQLWKSLWFRTLFWDKTRAHLIPEAPDHHTTCIKNARGVAREQILYRFRIHVNEDIQLPRIFPPLLFKDFEGNDVVVNQQAPVGFTHGLNFSQVLSVLLDGARLSRSVRTKHGLKGAWVAKEDDFETCDPYAGPERLLGDHGPWIQAFFVGQTWDLRNPGHPKYRCIRTRDGHVCTHFLLRIWPNDEEENKKLDTYHYRPLGGLDEEQTETFKKNLVANISMGERGLDPKRFRVGT